MAENRLLIDSYIDWVEGEGLPIYEGFGFNLLELEVRPWDRIGANGAAVHVSGRGDYLNVFLVELSAGKSTDPLRYLYEEVVYVLQGHGSTTIEDSSGVRHSFEWGPKSLFAIPLNAKHRHFNTSGTEVARLAAVTNLPMTMKLFRDSDFIFANPYDFSHRIGEARYFEGKGEFIANRPGRHMWETNFVPDLSNFELKEMPARGAGGSNIVFALAQGTMHAHMSEMPVGTYKKAHRHGPDFHIFPVSGHGYSLFWFEGDKDLNRIDWQHGSVYAPEDMMLHQHFNTSPEPVRYLAVAFGGLRFPFSEEKRRIIMGLDLDLRKGGTQIEYEDQDTRIHPLYLDELAKNGVTPSMDQFVKI